MKPTAPPSTNDADVICPACQTPNGRFESFCSNCGSPIGPTATLDPMSTIQTEGFLLRKALDRPLTPIVLIGIWVLFMPAGVMSAYLAVYYILTQRGLANFVFFWAFVLLTYIASVVLYRVTKNYIARRRPS